MPKRDPLPSYAGIQTFLRAPNVDLSEIAAGMVVIYGVPFEVSTRYGARFGPRAIREQSVHFQYYIDSDQNAEIVDLDTGRTLRRSDKQKVVDLGDINI